MTHPSDAYILEVKKWYSERLVSYCIIPGGEDDHVPEVLEQELDELTGHWAGPLSAPEEEPHG